MDRDKDGHLSTRLEHVEEGGEGEHREHRHYDYDLPAEEDEEEPYDMGSVQPHVDERTEGRVDVRQQERAESQHGEAGKPTQAMPEEHPQQGEAGEEGREAFAQTGDVERGLTEEMQRPQGPSPNYRYAMMIVGGVVLAVLFVLVLMRGTPSEDKIDDIPKPLHIDHPLPDDDKKAEPKPDSVREQPTPVRQDKKKEASLPDNKSLKHKKKKSEFHDPPSPGPRPKDAEAARQEYLDALAQVHRPEIKWRKDVNAVRPTRFTPYRWTRRLVQAIALVAVLVVLYYVVLFGSTFFQVPIPIINPPKPVSFWSTWTGTAVITVTAVAVLLLTLLISKSQQALPILATVLAYVTLFIALEASRGDSGIRSLFAEDVQWMATAFHALLMTLSCVLVLIPWFVPGGVVKRSWGVLLGLADALLIFII